MKKFDYYWPRLAVKVTGILFVPHLLLTPKPGFEWVDFALGAAFLASLAWAAVLVVLNARREISNKAAPNMQDQELDIK